MKFLLDIKKFVGNIFQKKSAIYELAKREFQAQNRNTYLGIIWGYIQPLTYIVLLALVFTIGLRTNPGGKVPFVVYLISGIIAWQFFSGTFSSLTGVVKSHSFLVRKGDFSLGILHIAKILSALIPHLALLTVTIIVCWFHGFLPGVYTLQLIYYLAAMSFLLLGLGWITSSTSIFVQDVSNVVTILTQFGFWFTPIIWNITRIPGKYQWIVKLNPMCYIVNGYRDSLIYKVPFWSKPYETLYFWIFTASVLLVGVVVFRKLKPHFGEVI
ncbi:MAG: ABC transporter permease [Candidatus Aminicenantes bacterium]|nr:ABC transporter permease [Candidatus Aminicenantes bacterium]NIM77609.1 ABC transporter permease [Candidatus Aminicenantes bacterium]NIN16923.1 ABC transporter permease [Candidatus Aminicenantes bacterium]NIN40816.1 ABC transporter permease [Candidatus Aminicenantes bacterium]NIN83620.1 ABC transporter permease [Candidatus Aminicenantes bacterium]